jgi:hypothetical protein
VTRLLVEDDTASPVAAKSSGSKQELGHGKQWDDEEFSVVDESVEGEPPNPESVVKLMIEVRGQNPIRSSWLE